MTQLENDTYGRTVMFYNDDAGDHYQVSGEMNNLFILTFPTGTNINQVYNSINSLAPC